MFFLGYFGFMWGFFFVFVGWFVLVFVSCVDVGVLDGFVIDGGVMVFDGSLVFLFNDCEDFDFDAGACFDGLDNDDDGTFDCVEVECGVCVECCVGLVECCSGVICLSILIVECEDGFVSVCDLFEGLMFFGVLMIEWTGFVF